MIDTKEIERVLDYLDAKAVSGEPEWSRLTTTKINLVRKALPWRQPEPRIREVEVQREREKDKSQQTYLIGALAFAVLALALSGLWP